MLREANKVVTAINGETPAKPGRFERCGCWRMRLTQPADRRHSLKRTDTAAASGDLAPRNKTRPKVTSPAGDHDDLIVFGAGSGGYVAAIRAAHLGLTVEAVEERYLGCGVPQHGLCSLKSVAAPR